MAEESFIIKSNRYGLTLVLDPEVPFDRLVQEIGEKFRESARFFRNAQMAISFRGRHLSGSEERAIIHAITSSSSMKIVCVLDEDKAKEEDAKTAVYHVLEEGDTTAEFHVGSVKAGESVESSRTLVILGDVDPGATAASSHSILVFGTALGILKAGTDGDRDAIAAAIVMKPRELHIESRLAVSAISKKENTGEYAPDPQIAYIAEDHLRIEKLTKETFDRLLTVKKGDSDVSPIPSEKL